MNSGLHFVSLMLFVVGVVSGDVKAESSTVDDWSAIVSQGLAKCLDQISNKESQSQWPSLVYVQPSQRQALGPAKKAYDLAQALVDELASYRQNLPALSAQNEEVFAKTVGQLQDFRDALIQQQGYINWTLADAVNRVAVVVLCRHILETRRAHAGIKAQADRLNRFGISVASWRRMIEGEQGSALSLYTPPGQRETTQGFLELITKTSGNVNLAEALGRKGVATYADFVDTKDVAGLLQAYMRTDALLHLSLPLLIQYVEQNPDFSLRDDYRQVKSKMQEKVDKNAVGSFLNPYEVSTLADIPRIMKAFESQKLDRWAGLVIKESIKDTVVAETENDEKIRTMLVAIDSVKQQLAVLEGLSAGADISVEKIEKFLGKQISGKSSLGTYKIGKIGEKPRFVRKSGQAVVLDP